MEMFDWRSLRLKFLHVGKNFFDKNRNWRDFSDDITYEEYKRYDRQATFGESKDYANKIFEGIGQKFFIDKAGYILAIREDLKNVIKVIVFEGYFRVQDMRDILEYRTMDYYEGIKCYDTCCK